MTEVTRSQHYAPCYDTVNSQVELVNNVCPRRSVSVTSYYDQTSSQYDPTVLDRLRPRSQQTESLRVERCYPDRAQHSVAGTQVHRSRDSRVMLPGRSDERIYYEGARLLSPMQANTAVRMDQRVPCEVPSRNPAIQESVIDDKILDAVVEKIWRTLQSAPPSHSGIDKAHHTSPSRRDPSASTFSLGLGQDVKSNDNLLRRFGSRRSNSNSPNRLRPRLSGSGFAWIHPRSSAAGTRLRAMASATARWLIGGRVRRLRSSSSKALNCSDSNESHQGPPERAFRL